jgi:large subunit ribosomal protein L5
MPRLDTIYREKLVAQLKEELKLSSVMEVPRIMKVTINMGLGEATTDKKIMEHALNDLQLISGQKPVVCLSRKSIAGFKIRDGWPIGAKVTLRRDRMYEFLDRLINIAIPRIGVKEQIIFPEIDFDKIDSIRGMDICITTNAKNDDEGRALLHAFNFPLRT